MIVYTLNINFGVSERQKNGLQKKSEANKAVRKMLSMKAEYWEKADNIADMDGTTRSAIIAHAIECFWKMRMKGESDEKI